MKYLKIVPAVVVALAFALSGVGCSSETETKEPKVQGPVDSRLKGGPVGRGAPAGGPAGKQAGGAGGPVGGVTKN
ncbi:MAG TPA: hypothetical protein VM533_06285 [Fimbriiglobus sp.]|jgi:hypothetical protein|nr:hypothetical protein [Fimbriiglobus sp.]